MTILSDENIDKVLKKKTENMNTSLHNKDSNISVF